MHEKHIFLHFSGSSVPLMQPWRGTKVSLNMLLLRVAIVYLLYRLNLDRLK